ncbi:MAG: hypothetical protein HY000_17565, partial [Planctomycetes bacterium]|nr:hypothetical protein [Planctomycetota bacterium]
NGDLQGVDAALAEARDLGVRHLDEIAAAESAALGLTPPECLAYLRDNLYFYLGPHEQQGMQLFCRLAAEYGLAPTGVELGFSDCQTA